MSIKRRILVGLWFAAEVYAQCYGNCPGGGGVITVAETPLEVVATSANELSIGNDCSVTKPCRVRAGAVVYTYTNPATATVTSGTGTAYIFVDQNGILTVGVPSGLNVSCSGCTVVSGLSNFPWDSIPVSTWSASSGQWTSGIDRRAILSTGRKFVAGTNISIVESGSTVEISSAGGGGGGGVDPLDPSTFWFKEEFWGGLGSAENVGFTSAGKSGGTCSFAGVTPETARFGVRAMSLSGTISAGQECVMYASTSAIGTGGGQFAVNLGPSLPAGHSWSGRWIVRSTTAPANIAAWVGFTWLDGSPFSHPNNPGIVVRYDPRGTSCSNGSDSTTNWVLQTYTSGTAITCVDTGVGFSANTWYNIEIFSTSAGVIQARVNNSTPVSSNTNVTDWVVSFGAGVLATSTNAPSFHQDFWSFRYQGAVR